MIKYNFYLNYEIVSAVSTMNNPEALLRKDLCLSDSNSDSDEY